MAGRDVYDICYQHHTIYHRLMNYGHTIALQLEAGDHIWMIEFVTWIDV